MPQMNKGGKFIFGRSVIGTDGSIQFPTQAIQEYHITAERKIFLFTGSKSTGGFYVSRKCLLLFSKLGHILTEQPQLLNYMVPLGEFVWYKGRAYCWLEISQHGTIQLSPETMNFSEIKPEMSLLSIRSSDIAFTIGAKGPLLKKQKNMRASFQSFDRAV